MRKIRIIEQISLDGVQQSADENDFPYGNWSAPYRPPAGRQLILAVYGESFGPLLGRRTYDMWSGSGQRRRAVRWRTASMPQQNISLPTVRKASHGGRPRPLDRTSSRARRIKVQDGPDVILSGSFTLTSTLLEHGLADEVLVVVFPVLLGTAKRIFADGTPPRSFELVSTKALASGVTLSTYRLNGPLRTGTLGG